MRKRSQGHSIQKYAQSTWHQGSKLGGYGDSISVMLEGKSGESRWEKGKGMAGAGR